jgi:hypothetical protein
MPQPVNGGCTNRQLFLERNRELQIACARLLDGQRGEVPTGAL